MTRREYLQQLADKYTEQRPAEVLRADERRLIGQALRDWAERMEEIEQPASSITPALPDQFIYPH